MDRARWLTIRLRSFDPKLYCERHRDGKLCVYRTSKRFETYQLENGCYLTTARSAPFFIFALTDNWKLTGAQADWGFEPILERLKAIDLQNRDVAGELIKSYEKNQASLDRERRNNTEAFFSETRSLFKKDFADINTSTLPKIDRRQKEEKKYGNN